MFGIKKVQAQLTSIEDGLTQLVSFTHEKEMQTSTRLKRMEENLSHQKLELSSIKAKFHDLGEKVAKIDQILLKNDEFKKSSITFHDSVIELLSEHKDMRDLFKEFMTKQSMMFEYINQLEKLMINVELIIDKCLPELTIKLPKPNTATTARF